MDTRNILAELPNQILEKAAEKMRVSIWRSVRTTITKRTFIDTLARAGAINKAAGHRPSVLTPTWLGKKAAIQNS